MICKCICKCNSTAKPFSGSLCGVCSYEVTYAPYHAEGLHGEKEGEL